MTCPLCGGTLREHVSRCAACPMNAGCDMLCCDSCGYQTVAARSVTVDFFKRLFGRTLARAKRGGGTAGAGADAAGGVTVPDRG